MFGAIQTDTGDLTPEDDLKAKVDEFKETLKHIERPDVKNPGLNVVALKTMIDRCQTALTYIRLSSREDGAPVSSVDLPEEVLAKTRAWTPQIAGDIWWTMHKFLRANKNEYAKQLEEAVHTLDRHTHLLHARSWHLHRRV